MRAVSALIPFERHARFGAHVVVDGVALHEHGDDHDREDDVGGEGEVAEDQDHHDVQQFPG